VKIEPLKLVWPPPTLPSVPEKDLGWRIGMFPGVNGLFTLVGPVKLNVEPGDAEVSVLVSLPDAWLVGKICLSPKRVPRCCSGGGVSDC